MNLWARGVTLMINPYTLRRLLLIFLLTMTISPQFAKEGNTAQIAFNQTIDLNEKIDEILTDEQLNGAITGVSIRSGETGELIYSHFGETRLRPASNMKILTSIAALETLGADHRFTTKVLVDGELDGNVLEGNVYIKGYGDPTLLQEDLDQFAKDLKAHGIHKITGNIFGDDSWYDGVRLSQDLNWSDESNYTGTQVSALTLSPNREYNAGTVIVEVEPGSKVGQEAKVTITPETDHVNIVNQTETVTKKTDKKISVEREHGTNTINVEGEIPINGIQSQSWVAVWEPTNYVLDIFKKSLEENGIQLMKESQMQQKPTPKEATVVTHKESMTLSELLKPFMKLSNNGHGEILTKEMGKVVYDEGSWDNGLQVIEEVMAKFDVDTETVLLRDGSGMSHKNMIPANEITELLYQIQQQSWYPVFENSLPIASEEDRLVGGTLRHRMIDPQLKGNIKAKTGNLTGVSTLSGYVTAKSGEKLIFSILINNYLGNDVTNIEDAIVTLLAEYEFK